jgi:hypothetical protein
MVREETKYCGCLARKNENSCEKKNQCARGYSTVVPTPNTVAVYRNLHASHQMIMSSVRACLGPFQIMTLEATSVLKGRIVLLPVGYCS